MTDTAAGVIAGGHPCPDCIDQTRAAQTSSGFCKQRTEMNKMEYLIVICVVAMMALYATIIAACLQQPQW
jgi:hypothetical protein